MRKFGLAVVVSAIAGPCFGSSNNLICSMETQSGESLGTLHIVLTEEASAVIVNGRYRDAGFANTSIQWEDVMNGKTFIASIDRYSGAFSVTGKDDLRRIISGQCAAAEQTKRKF